MGVKVRCKHWDICLLACKGKSFIVAWRVSKLPGCFEDDLPAPQPAPEPATVDLDDWDGHPVQELSDIISEQLFVCNHAAPTCPDECHRDPHPYSDEMVGGCDYGMCHNAHIEHTSECIPVPQPAPEPATERAGDDEPPFYGTYPGIVKAPTPVDLDVIQRSLATGGIGFEIGAQVVLTMCQEIARLRAELYELKRLGVAAGLARIAGGEGE